MRVIVTEPRLQRLSPVSYRPFQPVLRAHWPFLTFVALSSGILGWVAWDAFTSRLITYSGGADYWEHTAALNALLEDPLHPRNPHLVSEASSPRFGPHFVLIGAFGKLVGIDAIEAMAIASVLNTLLLLVGIYCLFSMYFRDTRAPLYGLIVMFGSWLDAPHWSNVYKLSVYFSVAGYPSNAALAFTLLGLSLTLNLLRSEHRKPGLLALACVLWAYVYIIHPLTAVMAVTAALALAATEPAVACRRRLETSGAVVGGLVLAGFWPYYPALGMVIWGTAESVTRELAADAPRQAPSFFYSLRTLLGVGGLALLSLPLLPYFLARRCHLFIVLGALTMLGVFAMNLFMPLPLGDRFVLLAVFFLQVALVWLLLALTPRGAQSAGWASRPLLRQSAALAVAVVLVYLTGSSVVTAMARFEKVGFKDESPTVRYARQVAAIAGPDGVVFGNPKASWPIPTFGPRVVTLKHGNPLVTDAEQRLQAARRFYLPGTSDDERWSILVRYGVTHVLSDEHSSDSAERFLRARGKLYRLPGGSRIYALAIPPHP